MARTRIRLVLDPTPAGSVASQEAFGGLVPGLKVIADEVLNIDSYAATVPAGQVGGYQEFTPVNGANALTDAQSYAEYLVAKTGLTGIATVTSTQPFSVFARQKFRNQTGFTITFKWAGDATGVAILTNTAVDVRCNGTIAVAALVGT